jgi:hypothetical protein
VGIKSHLNKLAPKLITPFSYKPNQSSSITIILYRQSQFNTSCMLKVLRSYITRCISNKFYNGSLTGGLDDS